MATPGVKEVIWMWEQGGWWKPYSHEETALLEKAFLEGTHEVEIFKGWDWSAIVNFKGDFCMDLPPLQDEPQQAARALAQEPAASHVVEELVQAR